MREDYSKYLYDGLKSYFPHIERKVVECKQFGAFDLIVKLNDGTAYQYSELNNSIRRVPSNGDDMSENDCRREFGYRLAQRLRLKGMTYDDLSKKTGISVNSIYSYINGKKTPSFYKVDKIARALDCPIDYFRYE